MQSLIGNMASINRLKYSMRDDYVPVADVVRFFYLNSTEEVETMQGLLIEQLKELYATESQVIEALSNLADAPEGFSLNEGLEHHLHEIRGHAQRLECVLSAVGMPPGEMACEAGECHGCNESADQFYQPGAGVGRL